MIGGTKLNQESGANSTNYQANNDIHKTEIHTHVGLTYPDVRQIAVDVFELNIQRFTDVALQVAEERAKKLIDDVLNKLNNINPDALNRLQDPAVQMALFSAQQQYAKTGDQDLEQLLVDILVGRVLEPERNLKQIVLDESIQVVSKLTGDQINTLSIIFLLRQTREPSIDSHAALITYIHNSLKPFFASLSKELSFYQHLEYASCGGISLAEIGVGTIFLNNYPGLFMKGFVPDVFTNDLTEPLITEINTNNTLFIKCLNDSTKFQINALNDEVFEELLKKLPVNDKDVAILKSVYNNDKMNNDEVQNVLIRQDQSMSNLIDVWSNSSLKNMTLTTVGIAIAATNYTRVTAESLNLNYWIK